MGKYVIIRRSNERHGIVRDLIDILEFKELICQDSSVKWGISPESDGGAIPVRNSDGSSGEFLLPEGFFLEENNNCNFYFCYEYSKGIAIHAGNSKAVRNLANRVARALSASVYEE